MQSPGKPVSNTWVGNFPNSRSPINIFSTTNDHPPHLQRDIIETQRIFKEFNELRSYFAPDLNGGLPMNVDFPDWGTILGFKGHVLQEMLVLRV